MHDEWVVVSPCMVTVCDFGVSDSKSGAGKPVEGSNPLPSASHWNDSDEENLSNAELLKSIKKERDGRPYMAETHCADRAIRMCFHVNQ